MEIKIAGLRSPVQNQTVALVRREGRGHRKCNNLRRLVISNHYCVVVHFISVLVGLEGDIVREFYFTDEQFSFPVAVSK